MRSDTAVFSLALMGSNDDLVFQDRQRRRSLRRQCPHQGLAQAIASRREVPYRRVIRYARGDDGRADQDRLRPADGDERPERMTIADLRDEERLQCLSAGMNDYLIKGQLHMELVEKIEDVT